MNTFLFHAKKPEFGLILQEIFPDQISQIQASLLCRGWRSSGLPVLIINRNGSPIYRKLVNYI